jgi:hypothetical protein
MKSSSNTGDPQLIAILAAALVVLYGLVVWLYLSEVTQERVGGGRFRP